MENYKEATLDGWIWHLGLEKVEQDGNLYI